MMRLILLAPLLPATVSFVIPIGSLHPQHRLATPLHMNLFDRFTRVAKASLNDVLKKVEDPEKIMNQALEDMQVRALRRFSFDSMM